MPMHIDEFSIGMSLSRVSVEDLQPSPRATELFKASLAEFKSLIDINDVLYHYCSTQEEWSKGMGSEGWIIVRDNLVKEELVRRIN